MRRKKVTINELKWLKEITEIFAVLIWDYLYKDLKVSNKFN